MNPELIAFVEGLVMGTVTNAKGGLLSFVYSKDWLGSSRAYPLSVAMPLAEEIYTDRKVRPFLWGLLPDSDTVLREWAQRCPAPSPAPRLVATENSVRVLASPPDRTERQSTARIATGGRSRVGDVIP